MHFRNSVILLSMIATLFLCSSAFALQSGDFTYTVSSDNTTVTITGYTGPGGAVVIPDTIDGIRVASIGYLAFQNKTSITGVTIPDSVTSIASYAFYQCTGLTSVTIPGSITSIGSDAFKGCTGLTSVSIGSGVASIGNWAFYGCTGLTSVTIPDSVTSIASYAFQGCTGLTSVSIGSGVTSIGDWAFGGCTGLTSVTIPDSVTTIGDYVFYGLTGLTSVSIGSGVKTIGYSVFNGCTRLASAYFYGTAPTMGTYVFASCAWGFTVYYLAGATGFTNPWYGYPTAVFDPNGATTTTMQPVSSSTTILPQTTTSTTTTTTILTWGDFTYTVSSDNTTVAITGYTGPGGAVVIPGTINGKPVVSIGYSAFMNKTSITGITIPGSVTSIESYAFNFCTGLTSVTIPGSVTSIANYAFNNCIGLASVTIGSGVTSIGSYAFRNCSGLTSIEVDGSNPSYSSQDGVLYNKTITLLILCPLGKSGEFTIPGGVTSIADYTFNGCTRLTSVTIPDSVTSIGYSAFAGCTHLTSMTIPDSVTSIGGYAFNGCAGLTSVTIGSGVTRIAYYTFYRCTGLASITIGSGVTSINSDMFYGCTGLASINIDPGNPSYSSQDGVLYNRNKTTLVMYPFGKSGSFTIPAGVTCIGNAAFSTCTRLTSVTMPASVTSMYGSTTVVDPEIGVYLYSPGSFRSCTLLISAFFLGNAPQILYEHSPDPYTQYYSGPFGNSATGFTVFYLAGAAGFTNPWQGYPTAVFFSSTTTTISDNSTTTTTPGDNSTTTVPAITTTTTTTSSIHRKLTVAKSGNGTGTVAGTGISCGSDCTELYNNGTLVTLTAAPDNSSTFTGWSGGDNCSGTGACTVTMSDNKTVTAAFTLKTYSTTTTMQPVSSTTTTSAPKTTTTTPPLTTTTTVGSNGSVKDDFNGDGISDILYNDTTSGNRYFVKLGTATGAFGAGENGFYLNAHSSVAGLADINGDGMADLLYNDTTSGNRYFVKLGTATGAFGAAGNGFYLNAHSSVAGLADINGDGMADLLYNDTTSGNRYFVKLGTGTGAFGAGGNGFYLNAHSSVVGLADINGDGMADLLYNDTTSGNRYFVKLGTGTGAFGAAGNGFYLNASSSVEGLADINGDGMADLLYNDTSSGNRYFVKPGTATGAFGAAGNGFYLNASSSVTALADYNGDGMADLLYNDTTSGNRYFLKPGTATGAFGAAGNGFYLNAHSTVQ